MIADSVDDSKKGNSKSHISTLFKIQGKLALREPYGIFGVIFPFGLLVLFWYIGTFVPEDVSGSGFSILDLYIPTVMIIGFITIAISFPNTLVRDREIGWLRRVSTTPVSPLRILGVNVFINLIFAIAMILLIIFGGQIIFGASLNLNIPFFILSIILSMAVIFSIGMVVVALAPSQTVASSLTGILFMVLLFFSGLWIQPVMLSGIWRTIMYYSPTGAGAELLLYSVFNKLPPNFSLEIAFICMVIYVFVFSTIAIRFFRWE